jgi:hypothetical protein
MNQPQQDSDERKFNETLKRMLQTPPQPHESAKGKQPDRSKAKPSGDASSKREDGEPSA